MAYKKCLQHTFVFPGIAGRKRKIVSLKLIKNSINDNFMIFLANYNPEDDEDYIVSQKNGNILGQIQSADNNNLRIPAIICDQPIRRNHSSILRYN